MVEATSWRASQSGFPFSRVIRRESDSWAFTSCSRNRRTAAARSINGYRRQASAPSWAKPMASSRFGVENGKRPMTSPRSPGLTALM